MIAHRQSNGMTLTELILTLAGITLILSFLIPSLIRRHENQVMLQAQSELRRLELAVTSYWRHHNNNYPTHLADLLSADPRVVSEVKIDPFHPDAGHYGYLADSRSGYYILWTRGPHNDTLEPTVGNGKVTFQGSGFVLSNYPVEKQ